MGLVYVGAAELTTVVAEVVWSDREGWARAAEVLRGGGLVVFPTDTVYGVGCSPRDVRAIENIYRAKGRSHLKAIPLLLSGVEICAQVAQSLPVAATQLGATLWPGALTLVVWRAEGLPVELGGGETIALRVPDHDGLRGFIERCGGAIAATSANRSGEPDALDAEQAFAALGDRVDVIVDGGRAAGGVPSTVVDVAAEPPRLLREGAVSRAEIERILGYQLG